MRIAGVVVVFALAFGSVAAGAAAPAVGESFELKEPVRGIACTIFPKPDVNTDAHADLKPGMLADYLGKVKVGGVEYARVRPWDWSIVKTPQEEREGGNEEFKSSAPQDLVGVFKATKALYATDDAPAAPVVEEFADTRGGVQLDEEARTLCVYHTGFDGVARRIPIQKRWAFGAGVVALPVKLRLGKPSVSSDFSLALSLLVRRRLSQAKNWHMVFGAVGGVSKVALGHEPDCVAQTRTSTSSVTTTSTDEETSTETKTTDTVTDTRVVTTCPSAESGAGLGVGVMWGVGVGPAELGIALGSDFVFGDTADRWLDRDAPLWLGLSLSASGGLFNFGAKKN